MNTRKGFASMSPDTRRELARMGGQAAQRSGKVHRFSSEEAKSAGKKGNTRLRELLGEDGYREHMRKIGIKGGAVMAARIAGGSDSNARKSG